MPREVIEAGEPGTFDLKGLNLFMRGPWEVQRAVNTADGASSASEATSCDRDRDTLGREESKGIAMRSAGYYYLAS